MLLLAARLECRLCLCVTNMEGATAISLEVLYGSPRQSLQARQYRLPSRGGRSEVLVSRSTVVLTVTLYVDISSCRWRYDSTCECKSVATSRFCMMEIVGKFVSDSSRSYLA